MLVGPVYLRAPALARRSSVPSRRGSTERPRAAARGAVELLPQARCWRSSPAPSCPWSILAVATRTYFAAQARAGVEAEAVKTVTVAQRLVEDYATLQRSGSAGARRLDDQIMVLVGRAIDQAVNLFDRDALRRRASAICSRPRSCTPRTPSAVYRSIVLDRLPTFVGEEEVGGSRYLVAAAPVRDRRTRRHRHRAADASPAGDRAADRRAEPAGPLRGRALRACSARRSATGWRSASPIR